MKSLSRTGILCLMVGATTAGAQSSSLPASDVEAIRVVSKAYAQAALSKTWSTWIGFFTADAMFLPPNEPLKNGRAEIDAWVRTFPPMKELRLDPVEIEGRGDLAYVRGRYTLVMTPPNQPEQPDSGKYIEIWRKQSDGSWKIHRDTFNSDRPLAPAAPAASPKKD